jgi:hypothetical protein
MKERRANPPGECRDCQHAKPELGIVSWFGWSRDKWELALCQRPNTGRPAPIYCKTERAIPMMDYCGPEGRAYEPRGK